MEYPHTNMLIVDFPPDTTDISDDLVFEGNLFEDIQEGTAIVPRVRLAEGIYLKVLSQEDDGSWTAWWHDETGESTYSGSMFRIEPLGGCDEGGLRRESFRAVLQTEQPGDEDASDRENSDVSNDRAERAGIVEEEPA